MNTDNPAQPLSYSTLTAGQLSWQRAGDFLLITLQEPPREHPARKWYVLPSIWTAIVVGCLAIAHMMGAARATRSGLLAAAFLVLTHAILTLPSIDTGPRRVVIRVNRHQLLIDEHTPRRFFRQDAHGVTASVRGRTWSADEIVAVTAGTILRIKTKNRRLAPFSLAGYDPSDLAWTAQTVTAVLKDGIDTWLARQSS